ncbi:hypothetical protein FOCC_FOCC001061 [Frankliniella occidentalis]|nr:hypothetical protein FOCC_FOCC001061 [Frankliniella occidentalis]
MRGRHLRDALQAAEARRRPLRRGDLRLPGLQEQGPLRHAGLRLRRRRHGQHRRGLLHLRWRRRRPHHARGARHAAPDAGAAAQAALRHLQQRLPQRPLRPRRHVRQLQLVRHQQGRRGRESNEPLKRVPGRPVVLLCVAPGGRCGIAKAGRWTDGHRGGHPPAPHSIPSGPPAPPSLRAFDISPKSSAPPPPPPLSPSLLWCSRGLNCQCRVASRLPPLRARHGPARGRRGRGGVNHSQSAKGKERHVGS